MNTRIKQARKALGLTQEEFAKRLGTVQNTITGYETGRREPSNVVISSICREFDINENWLRTGEGEMRNHLEYDEYTAIVSKIDISDPRAKQAIIDYWNLNPKEKEKFWNFVDIFIKKS